LKEYTEFNFEDVAKALKKVRKQYLKGKPLVWTGPDVLHFTIAATSMPPSWYFSEEGMEYAKENGRDFWDVYTQVAFQIGYHNGVVYQSKDSLFWHENSKFWQRLAMERGNR